LKNDNSAYFKHLFYLSMKEQSKDIEIGHGLGSITFGMTWDELEEVAGAPDEKETYALSDDEEDNAETWHYDDMGLSMSFEELEQWLLTSISVSSPEYRLKGKQLIGLNLEQVIAELEKMDLGEIEIEDSSTEEGVNEKVVSIDDASLNFWFEEDILTEIQWNPLWPDDEDEEEDEEEK
jgi:hypothetical protein